MGAICGGVRRGGGAATSGCFALWWFGGGCFEVGAICEVEGIGGRGEL